MMMLHVQYCLDPSRLQWKLVVKHLQMEESVLHTTSLITNALNVVCDSYCMHSNNNIYTAHNYIIIILCFQFASSTFLFKLGGLFLPSV